MKKRMIAAVAASVCFSGPSFAGGGARKGGSYRGGVIGCKFLRLGYHLGMQISTGTVVGGKIVVEGLSLPEGTVVTVLTPEDDIVVKLAPHLENELLEAIDEADQEEGGAGPEFLEGLKRYG